MNGERFFSFFASSSSELFRKHSLSGEAFNLSDEKPVSVIKLLKEIKSIAFDATKLNYKILNTAKCEIKEQHLSSAKARRARQRIV